MSSPSPHLPPRYQIPTHLNVPDKLEIPLFGVTISLTMRQAVIYLFGGSTAFGLWQHLRWLDHAGPLGITAHWGATSLLALLTCLLALVRIRERYLERWGMIWLQYVAQPKIYVWRHAASALAGGPQRQKAETEPQEGEAA
jgi:hypothetical protein